MAGFSIGSDGSDVLFADNVDFSGGVVPQPQITLNGQLLIGSTALPHIRTNTLTAGSGISITNGAGSITIATTGAGADLHTARFIVSAGGAADGANYTTIGAAIAAAQLVGGNQTIFIQPGTYTENLTLSAGINLSAYDCDANTPNVIILGKASASFSGSCSISGIQLKTNSDFCLQVTGSNATIVNLTSCFIDVNNNTALLMSNSNGLSKINLYQCNGNIDTTGIAYFSITGAGAIRFFGGVYSNTGGSITASTNSSSTSGSVRFDGVSEFINAITTSNSGQFAVNNSFMNGEQILGGTGTNTINNCRIEGNGSNPAISVGTGASLSINIADIDSINTNAITGAGQVNFGGIVFTNSSSLINTTTQVPLVRSNDAIKVTTPGAYPYTTVPQDALILVDSSAARTITPLASPATGQMHIIKDNVGSAAANNITVTPSGKNIDGAASKIINVNFGSITIVFNGTQWNVI